VTASTVFVCHEFLELWGSGGKVGIPDEVQKAMAGVGVPILAGDCVCEVLDSGGVEEAEAFSED